ncbi:hypothetical protein A7D00_0669 [Trichophyton violaceum]|uniref:Uncharacterized protein n=1 Tax=Trichophyton violaceum TaxID=34388 RepID=A0A178FRM8_TRIVO|nr:hypothetical protein A7D00_0669 [Trichophyton violaceum]
MAANDSTNNAEGTNAATGPAAPAAPAVPAVPAGPSTRFYSKHAQNKGQYGRRWDSSESKLETSGPPGALNSFPGPRPAAPAAPPAASRPNPAAPPFTPAPRKWGPSPAAGASGSSSAGADTGKDYKRKNRKFKPRKERKDGTPTNTPVSDAPDGLKDTTNRRPQRRNMPGTRNPGMRRRNEEGGRSATPGANQDEPTVVEAPANDKTPAVPAQEDNAVKEQPVGTEEPKAMTPPKEEDAKPVEVNQASDAPVPKDVEVSPPKDAEDTPKPASEPAEEKAEAVPSLIKWSPIFPPGGPRPTPALNDGASGDQPKRTNYVDANGNYHAPNGTIMSAELLKLFATGKIRNSLGDKVYFMPSFIENHPPEGQQPYPLAGTPSRIFYDPRDFKKASQ